MTAFRKGDRVSIEGVVDTDMLNDNEVRVTLDGVWGSGSHYYIKVGNLRMVQAGLAIGDRVELPRGGRGEVVGIFAAMVWAKLDTGAFTSIPAVDCTRVDPEPAHDPDFDEIEEPPVPPTAEAPEIPY